MEITDETLPEGAAIQRASESAFSSWRIGRAPSSTLASGLSLSTVASDIDLKDFLTQRGK